MKIWQKIKELIFRIKTKKLEAPMEKEIDSSELIEINRREDSLRLPQIEKVELSDKEKLEEILKTIGCCKESIQQIIEIPNINIANFRKNLFEINKFDYSNLELAIVITQNQDLITMDNEFLKEQIQKVKEYFKDEIKVKNLIYSNSNILSEKIEEVLEGTEKIFENYGISIKKYTDIIIENSNILFIAKNKLRNSLRIIREYAKTQEKFTKFVIMEPLIIGIQDIKKIENYM